MKYILFLFIGFLYLNANTTMCYKNNWSDPSTIEDESLDGGECKGEKSLNDMKKEAWLVSDIKISSSDNGMNYIYILKKDNTEDENKKVDVKNIDYKKLASKLEEEKEQEQAETNFEDGKNVYQKTCQRCHGEFGEKKAYGSSRPLKTLSAEDLQVSIRDYKLSQYDRGRAMIMKPYTNMVTKDELEGIAAYLKSINSK